MEAKLIILNGPSGVGKSTLAQKYVDEHPMALNLDTDNVWSMMGQWREEKERSSRQKLRLAYAMAEAHLEAGYDVIVPNIMRSRPTVEKFEAIAQKCGALFCELLLTVSKDEAIERFMARGGFRPGGILAQGGIPYLEQMYDDMVETAATRPSIIEVATEYGNIQGTYQNLLKALLERI